jgi:hypothetical protein
MAVLCRASRGSFLAHSGRTLPSQRCPVSGVADLSAQFAELSANAPKLTRPYAEIFRNCGTGREGRQCNSNAPGAVKSSRDASVVTAADVLQLTAATRLAGSPRGKKSPDSSFGQKRANSPDFSMGLLAVGIRRFESCQVSQPVRGFGTSGD